MLTLYHHGSSACAAKVRFVLDEKQLEWEGRYIDLMRGEQFAPEYVALNPKAVVPTLVHDNNVITESTIICEYLDEVFGTRRLYPDDPVQRAAVRQWTKAVDEELHPACSAVTYTVSHRHTILRNGAGRFEDFLAAGGTEGRTARERKWQWIQQGLDAPGAAEQLRIFAGYIEKMDRALDGRDWLVGDDFSIADVAMTPYVNRLRALSLEQVWAGGRLPNVSAWFERIAARPAFDSALLRWVPKQLADEMAANGRKSLPKVISILSL